MKTRAVSSFEARSRLGRPRDSRSALGACRSISSRRLVMASPLIRRSSDNSSRICGGVTAHCQRCLECCRTFTMPLRSPGDAGSQSAKL